MRRWLAALALVAALPVLPPATAEPAAAPAPAAPAIAPGLLRPGPPEADLFRRWESLAVTPEAREQVKRMGGARALSHEGYYRYAGATATADLDGDGSGDVLMYDTEFDILEDFYLDGHSTLALFNGRTGRQVWRRTFEDMPAPLVFAAKVGERLGEPGLVLVTPFGTVSRGAGLRFLSITGRGRVLWDRSVTETDGLGHVFFGGFLDAVPNGGDDLLIPRTQYLGLEVNATIASLRVPEADLSQMWVIDGRNGRYYAATERMLGFGGWVAFTAGGDYDRDRRDDVLEFRWALTGSRGSVTARSLGENRLIWRNDSVTLGSSVWIASLGNVTGEARDDVFYETAMGNGGLGIPGVTDEIALLPLDPGGVHAIALDGRDGALAWQRWDAEAYSAYADVDRDGRLDVLAYDVFVNERRGGIVFSLTLANGRELWAREVSLPVDVPLLTNAGGGALSAGDVDADGVPDLWYSIWTGSTDVTTRQTRGFLFGKTGRTLTTNDFPLGGTLDGRGADRYGYAYVENVETVSMREGLSGRSFWQVQVRSPHKELFLDVRQLERAQRRRCANVALVSYGIRDHAGQVWATVLDGTTGRIVWSKRLLGGGQAALILPRGGPRAHCA